MLAIPSAAERASTKVAENAVAIMTGKAETALDKALPKFVSGLSKTVGEVAQKQADQDLILVLCWLAVFFCVVVSVTFGFGYLAGVNTAGSAAVYPMWWTGKNQFDFLMRAPTGLAGLWAGLLISIASLVIRKIPVAPPQGVGQWTKRAWHVPSIAFFAFFAIALFFSYQI